MKHACLTSALLLSSMTSTSTLAQLPCPDPDWIRVDPAAGSSHASRCSTVWDRDGAGPLAPVLVVDGDFSSVHDTLASRIALWDGQEWSALSPDSFPDGSYIDDLMVLNGDLIASGKFSQIGSLSATNIARWNNAASKWEALGPGLGGTGPEDIVNTLAVYNGQLIAAGSFTTSGATPIARIARWDGAAWQPLGAGILPSGKKSATVDDMAVLGGNLYVGGNFYKAGGVLADCLARWDGAAWSPIASVVSGVVLALEVDASQRLIVGGSFTSINGVPALNIAAWDGATWSAIGLAGGGPDANVYAIHAVGNALYVGGAFRYVNDIKAPLVAYWNGAAWNPLSQQDGSTNWTIGVKSLTSYHGDLYAVGGMGLIDGFPLANIGRWDGTAWHRVGDGTYGEVRSVVTYNDKLLVGGSFITADDTKYLATLEGSTWKAFEPAVVRGPVSALCTDGEALYVGSTDLYIDGKFLNLGRWDGSTWSSLGGVFGKLPNPYQVLALHTHEGDVYAAGTFVAPFPSIARWDGAAWSSLGSGLNGPARALTSFNGDLIVGGSFFTAGDVSAGGVARWDGSQWHAMQPVYLDLVYDFATLNGELYLAGLNPHGVRKWTGAEWVPFNTPFGASNIYAMHGWNNQLVVGGDFTALKDETPLPRLAVTDGATWSVFEGGVDATVRAIGDHHGQLVIGGAFNMVDGQASGKLALFGCPASACYADCDATGELNIDDFVCFQTVFALGDPQADCDASGSLNIDDFVCFQTAFAVGC